MGWRSAWIGVDGADLDELAAALGVRRTGAVEEDHFDPGLVGLRLGTWTIVFADGSAHFTRWSADDARRVSSMGPTLFLWQSDTSMVDEIRAFAAGEQQWAVEHAELGDLRVTGAPPPELDEIVEECRRRQAAETSEDGIEADWLYEVAPELGRVITGFRHDDPDADDGFFVLGPVAG